MFDDCGKVRTHSEVWRRYDWVQEVPLICSLSALATACAQGKRAGAAVGRADVLMLERWCWSGQGACWVWCLRKAAEVMVCAWAQSLNEVVGGQVLCTDGEP